MPKYLTILLCLILGGLSGYWIGQSASEQRTPPYISYETKLHQQTHTPNPDPSSTNQSPSSTAEYGRYYSTADQANVAELQQLIRQAQTFVPARRRKAALSAAFGALVAENPEAAVEQAQTLSNVDRRTALNAVFESWPETQQHQAVSLIKEMTNRRDRNSAAQALLTSSLGSDQLAMLLMDELADDFGIHLLSVRIL